MDQPQKFNWMSMMVKVDRFAAWTMFTVALLFAITGFGMTKQIIDPRLATTLHFTWLGIVGLAAFALHTSWAIHLAFKRWKIWNKFSKTLLIAFYILTVVIFCYLGFFYSPQAAPSAPQAAVSNPPITDMIAAASSTQTTVFTAKELSKFNGLNGQPAYVAVDGVVYDASSWFVNGVHHGIQAGKDVTQAFQGKHPASYLGKLKVVGSFQSTP